MAAYASDTVKVMSYNLLNYPEPGNPAADTTVRNVHFRTVLSHTNPDIVVAQELTSQAGVNYFLTKVEPAAQVLSIISMLIMLTASVPKWSLEKNLTSLMH